VKSAGRGHSRTLKKRGEKTGKLDRGGRKNLESNHRLFRRNPKNPPTSEEARKQSRGRGKLRRDPGEGRTYAINDKSENLRTGRLKWLASREDETVQQL